MIKNEQKKNTMLRRQENIKIRQMIINMSQPYRKISKLLKSSMHTEKKKKIQCLGNKGI